MAGEYPFGIGINDKDRFMKGVEENRVCGLRTDSREVEQLLTQGEGVEAS